MKSRLQGGPEEEQVQSETDRVQDSCWMPRLAQHIQRRQGMWQYKQALQAVPEHEVQQHLELDVQRAVALAVEP